MRVAHWLDDFVRDLRYAARLMERTRGFTAVAVLSLALGIGAATAIFTLFDALLLKPLPVDRPGELRVTTLLMHAGERIAKRGGFSYPWFRDLTANPDVFTEVLAFSELPDVPIAHGNHELRTRGGVVFVSDNYFTALGVPAAHGRRFAPVRDGAPDSQLTAMLSDGFWAREFGRDLALVGQAIRVNGTPFIVIGITPPEFFGLRIGHVPDVFLPLDAFTAAQPGQTRLADQANWRVEVVGRLKPGLSDAVAGERLTTLRDSLAPRGPSQPKTTVIVAPLETGLSGVRERFAQPLWLLLGMVGLLLFIGCANAATMLVSRASARRVELAIRSSVGASRGRLLRQLGAESLLLAALGGIGGLAVALWLVDALYAMLPRGDDAVLLTLRLDRRVLGFTTGLCSLAAVLSTVIPAVPLLGTNTRRPAGAGLARPFMVGQLALTLVLLIGAGLLTRTLLELTRVDPGFHTDRVVLATVEPGSRDYDPHRLDRYYRDVLERLRQLPGITSATLSQLSFLGSSRTTGTVEVPGYTPRSDDDRWVQVFYVGPDFFATLGIPLIAGRDFMAGDMSGGPRVAAINEVAARRYFGGRDPIGRMVSARRVIAVVRNARYNTLRDDEVPALFVPFAPNPRGRMVFAVRTHLPEHAALDVVRATVRAIDPLVPHRITTLEAARQHSVSQERLLAAISTFFAIAGLLLVAVGLYGVMAFWVTERTREIGVRVALGAAPRRVLWSVLRRVLGFVAAGTALGIAAAVGGSRLIATLLFGLTPHDPLTIAGAALLLALVAILAGYVPARRAARVDPIVALHYE